MLTIDRSVLCSKCNANTVHRIIIIKRYGIYEINCFCSRCGNKRFLKVSEDDFIELVRRYKEQAPNPEDVI